MPVYSVDVTAIKAAMGGREVSKTQLAARLGISRNTLVGYFKEPRKIPYSAIVGLARELELTSEQMREIFFKEKLA